MECSTRCIGIWAEELACRYLSTHMYVIQERNWRYKKAEIDIIAEKEDILVFIEVKSRSYVYFGEPETAVSSRKMELIGHAAQRYMEKIGYDWAIRFDIIAIQFNANFKPHILRHFEDVNF